MMDSFQHETKIKKMSRKQVPAHLTISNQLIWFIVPAEKKMA